MDRSALQERFQIIGTSPGISQVVDRIRQVSNSDITVLIQGESGVGKELVAGPIHQLSGRRHNPFVPVNCGAIPEGLIESELFGSEKGAFTGSVEQRQGYFEQADTGTIFLDEIGEMPLQAQVRLLRVLESGEFNRVGSSKETKVDVRIVAATNKDLIAEVRKGKFREDLYYRLSTVTIEVPPLRERREDIMPIFEHFAYRFAQKYNAPVRRLDDGAREMLVRYYWPGNVRELRNVAEQSIVLMTGDTVSAEQLQPYLRNPEGASSQGLAVADGPDSFDDLRDRQLMYRMLMELKLEISEIKELLGPSRFQNRSRDMIFDDAGRPKEFRKDRALPPPASSEADRWGEIEDVPFEVALDAEAGPEAQDEGLPTLEEAERDLITKALKQFNGNRRRTAQALRISERTLYRKLKEMDVDDEVE